MFVKCSQACLAGREAPATSTPPETDAASAVVSAAAAAAADAAAVAAEQAVGARMAAMQQQIDDQRKALARAEAALARERQLRESTPVTIGVVVDSVADAAPAVVVGDADGVAAGRRRGGAGTFSG